MTARQHPDSAAAIAHALRTGCTPADAAARYGVSVRTVQRGVAAVGAARPSGNPAWRQAPTPKPAD